MIIETLDRFNYNADARPIDNLACFESLCAQVFGPVGDDESFELAVKAFVQRHVTHTHSWLEICQRVFGEFEGLNFYIRNAFKVV